MLLFSTQGHKRRQPTTPESIARVDLDEALGFYKARFADASSFTFVLVGNLDLDRTRALVETYLGSLPAAGEGQPHHPGRRCRALRLRVHPADASSRRPVANAILGFATTEILGHYVDGVLAATEASPAWAARNTSDDSEAHFRMRPPGYTQSPILCRSTC
jgi:hypothetical protein